jgi:TnpA family transposase
LPTSWTACCINHETDLRPREHYADTKGYTDALFGLCHLLGFRFAPRLRDLSERRLFRMRRSMDDYPNIQSLFAAPINTRVIRDRWDDVLRLAASVESGVMPASFCVLSSPMRSRPRRRR